MKKIYTCTPISFHANEGFWIRDTGLINRNLRRAGVDSKCILRKPTHEDDESSEYVIRASLWNLMSATWWKKLNLDGVILYSWGLPQYLPIARALRKADIPFSIHWDGGSDMLPPHHLPFPKRLFIWGKFLMMDYLRAKHLSYANAVTMAPPVRDAFMLRNVYRLTHLAEKCIESPCPVSGDCRYDGREKENLIIAVGRWNDEKQKRQQFLMKTLNAYYTDGGNAATEIYGIITAELQDWYASLPEPTRKHIILKGYLNNDRLKDVYRRARCILCTSSHEGSHNVSAEALCCGCSVVTTNRPKELAVVHWYTSRQSGSIAKNDSPEALAEALHSELRAWEERKRNPAEIAAYWYAHFHVEKTYAEIFKLH